MNKKNKFSIDFLKLKSELFHQNEQNIKAYKKLSFAISKDILVEELNNSNGKAKFLIRTQAYQRFDNYSWDWDIFIKLKNNHNLKYEKILNERIKLLTNCISLEKEIIDFKLNNFDDYYDFKYQDELNNKLMWQEMVDKSKWSVKVEWLNKPIISKEKLKNILNIQQQLLTKQIVDKKIILKKDIFEINTEFDFLNFNSSNPFYWYLLDIYDYLLDFKIFKKDFYMDYPIVKDKKNKVIFHSRFMKNYVNNRYNHWIYDNYFLLANPIIETIPDIIFSIKSYEKVVKKVANEKYFQDEIQRLSNILDIYKQWINIHGWLFFKENEEENIYYLIKWNVKNLVKVMWYSVIDKFDLDTKTSSEIKKSDFEVSVKFITY